MSYVQLIKVNLAALSILMFLSTLVPLPNQTLFAASPKTNCVGGQVYDTSSKSCITPISPGNLPPSSTDSIKVKRILAIVFAIVGALAFLMVVISGFRYILSGGDPGKISKAKEGLVYSLVGLLVAITAEALVAYVIKSV